MLSHFITVCLALLPFAQCLEVHNHMTEEEFQKTFGTGRDNVPEYDLVRLHHNFHKRDINNNPSLRIKYNDNGKEINLFLEPKEGLLASESTPVWTVDANSAYTLQPNVLKNVGQAYQSVPDMSSIIVFPDDDGETLMYGTLMNKKIVRPLPSRLCNVARREARDVDALPDGVDGVADFRRTNYHVIFERHERDTNANGVNMQDVERKRRTSRATDNNRIVPKIVYPEIVVTVDFLVYESIGKKLEDVARYVLAFMNAVDLRYRSVEKPIVRLNIAGIIISTAPAGIRYLSNVPKYDDGIKVNFAINSMSTHFGSVFPKYPLETYDVAITLTGFKTYYQSGNGIRLIESTGMPESICSSDEADTEFKAIAIIHDNGGFYGILNTAYQLASMMGVSGDGSGRNSRCSSQTANLMSPTYIKNSNNFRFSECSLRNLEDFLSSPEAACLHNEPHQGQALPRLLPGTILKLDEQCKKWKGPQSQACYHDATACAALQCKSSMYGSCEKMRGAAEGSSCGNEMHCIHGYCVKKNARYLPQE